MADLVSPFRSLGKATRIGLIMASLAVIAAVGVVACSSPDPTPTPVPPAPTATPRPAAPTATPTVAPATATPAPPAAESAKIGTLLDATGDLAAFGPPIATAVDLGQRSWRRQRRRPRGCAPRLWHQRADRYGCRERAGQHRRRWRNRWIAVFRRNPRSGHSPQTVPWRRGAGIASLDLARAHDARRQRLPIPHNRLGRAPRGLCWRSWHPSSSTTTSQRSTSTTLTEKACRATSAMRCSR